MKNHRGQVTIEIVLILVVSVGVALAVSKGFRENQFFANLVSGPWRSLAGLIQNGSWGSPEKTMSRHPNHVSRLSSVRAQPVGEK